MLPPPEALQELLARHGAQASPWLQRQFGISQPSLSRVMARAVAVLPALRRFGRGKSTLYALAAAAPPVPVWRITEAGERILLGELHALVLGQWLFAPAGLGTPTLTEGPPPWVTALPSCLEMGGDPSPCRSELARDSRQQAASYNESTALGADSLTCGSELARDCRQQAASHRGSRQQAASYSATALHAERLSDLAVAEYLAAQLLRAAKVPMGDCELTTLPAPEGTPPSSARYAVHWQPYDRVGEQGRRALWPLAAAQPGLPERLVEALPLLRRRGALGPGVGNALHWLTTFADCLGDDLHASQLAFAPIGAAAVLPVPPWPGLPAPKPLDWRSPPQARVAHVGAIFPRCYLPAAGGTLPAEALDTLPTGLPRAVRAAAERYWRQLAQDTRVSFGFRLIAAANARKLEQRAVRPGAG
jgi:hypothetical protein